MGSGPPPEAEQAWPQSSGEEELQLQLALAMSKEEADQVRAAEGGAAFCSAILSSCLARLPLPPLSLPSGASPPSTSSSLLPGGRLSCPLAVRCTAAFSALRHRLGRRPVPVFLDLAQPGLLSLGRPASLTGALALASPALPLILSLRQPPSCGPEDDVQLQLALSLSREEHDKVRVASPPLPGLPLLLVLS